MKKPFKRVTWAFIRSLIGVGLICLFMTLGHKVNEFYYVVVQILATVALIGWQMESGERAKAEFHNDLIEEVYRSREPDDFSEGTDSSKEPQ